MRRNYCQAKNHGEWKYCSAEECIIEEGVFATASELPDWINRGELKQCYRNASNLAISHANLRYVEGYGVFRGIPVQHAWVYDMVTGLHHEVTWPEEGREYYGVVFDTAYITSLMLKTERYGVWSSEHYACLESVMRTGFPDWAVLKFGEHVKK